ncbi:hypothetical protein [Methylomonas sp. AM2-LC]|uniref:hypothetical protein n=1 Tax=Methylomonas sp. AM2-LC TaxID=3153301 RepID=UPI003266DB6A
MKFTGSTLIAVSAMVTMLSMGCGTKFGRDFEKQVDNTKTGIFDTKTNIEEGLSKNCADEPKVSDQADEVLRLVSSEEQTLFTVDGKEMGRAKQLKVCIDSSAQHTVVAEPPGCEAKTERLRPPYDFPVYEFRFMLADCKAVAPQATQATPQLEKKLNTRKKH